MRTSLNEARFMGTVQDAGYIDMDWPRAFQTHLLHLRGKRVDVTVEAHRARRSDDQNKLFHVLCHAIGDHLGWEMEEVKEYLKQKFLLIEKDGRQFCRPTSSLDTAGMSDLIERSIRWAAMELGFVFYTQREEAEMRQAVSE
jgi:hypothetical protein